MTIAFSAFALVLIPRYNSSLKINREITGNIDVNTSISVLCSLMKSLVYLREINSNVLQCDVV